MGFAFGDVPPTTVGPKRELGKAVRLSDDTLTTLFHYRLSGPSDRGTRPIKGKTAANTVLCANL